MRKIAFKTLGCRVNLYETDALASQFAANGYTIVDFASKADVYVVNTCTVTNQSDQKCRQFLHQVRKRNPDSIIVATGCYVNNHREGIADIVDFAIDNERKSFLFHIVDSYLNGDPCDLDELDAELFRYEPAFNTFHTRSLIKIQDGCNNFCSYCIIPMVRGREASRKATDIYDNVKQVVDRGFKEVVLTGVNMSRYRDGGTRFEDLVENIIAIDGDFRVHVSSVEPDDFSLRFLQMFHNSKLSSHMHICLQSGSDTTLKRMNRHYSAGQFSELCNRIVTENPNFNLTTDVIVGFPGETDDEFNETVNMVKELKFSHVHTFKYSRRNGTKAADMPNQIPDAVKTERSNIIRRISAENERNYFESMVGRKQRMLVERIDSNGVARGYGENYIPLRFVGGGVSRNSFTDVRIASVTEVGGKLECIATKV